MAVVFASITVILSALIGGVMGAGANWFFGERSRTRWKSYVMREEKYGKMVKNLWGFHLKSIDDVQRRDFVDQVNSLWLYAPDEVYRKALLFLESVHIEVDNEIRAQKELRLGELMLAMRIDLIKNFPLKKTALHPSDFQYFGITSVKNLPPR